MATAAGEALHVLRRELRLEWNGREATVSTLPYVAAVLILVGLGLDSQPKILEPLVPTLVWVVVLGSATPLTRLVAAAEVDDGSWELLRALVRPTALVAGKTVFIWITLAAVWGTATLLATVVLADPGWHPAVVLAGLLGCLGLALNAAAIGILTGDAARRGGLVATLLAPAGVPVLLAGTRIAEGVAVGPWLTLLVVYDAVVAVTVWALTPHLLES